MLFVTFMISFIIGMSQRMQRPKMAREIEKARENNNEKKK